MDRKVITSKNEELVRTWFESIGFASVRLDSDDGKKGKNADWKFTKQELVVVCEVKTIFSGGQVGLTREQWERRRKGEKKFLDKVISELPTGDQLVATQDYLDYVHGKTLFRKPVIRKESAYQEYKHNLKYQLENDPEIQQLPFDMSISIDALYVPKAIQHREFFDWLKGFVLWAERHHDLVRWYSEGTFTFIPSSRSDDGTRHGATLAFVQVIGPDIVPKFNVKFIEHGVPYNEQGVTQQIEDAVGQIVASIRKQGLEGVKSMVALWSASDFLYFEMLLFNDFIDTQLNHPPQRYQLFDRVFADERYSDLTAIALFDLKRTQQLKLLEFPEQSELVPFAYIITNPLQPQDEYDLKNAIGEHHCRFIRGTDANPLA